MAPMKILPFAGARLFILFFVSAGSMSFAAELKVPADVQFDRGVEYSNPDNQHLQLDLARPKEAKSPLPAILCIHGGGFRAGTREGYDGLCVKLAQHGFVAATLTYRLAPKFQF